VYQTTDFRKGLKVEMDGRPYVIVSCQHVSPGKGPAFVRTKLKNLETGQVLEKTFKVGADKLERPDLEERPMEYLYDDLDGHNFMDQINYETIHIPKDQVADSVHYLQEGIKVTILYYKGRPISLELPNFVNLKVKETDPGLKGDTSSGGGKKAIMETGLQVTVPLFIKVGEVIKIDTRSGEYVERVKS